MNSKIKGVLAACMLAISMILVSAEAVSAADMKVAYTSDNSENDDDTDNIEKAPVKKGFVKKNGEKYYIKSNGRPATGIYKIDGEVYLFSKTGIMKTNCWYRNKSNNKRMYFGNNGRARKDCKIEYEGRYYFLNESGYAITGWHKSEYGNKFYLNNNGAAVTGWKKLGGSWYYFKENGSLKTGWHKEGGKTYYLSPLDGAMVTGRVKLNNCIYYFKANGELARTVDGSKKMVAITYDDGPSAYTPIVLDTLERYNAAATFYVVGNRLGTYSAYAKREAELYNEIGIHTYSHAILTRLGAGDVINQIQSGANAIKNTTGVAPSTLRTPGGGVNNIVKANAGYPIILWSVDTLDWKTRSSTATTSRVLDGVYDGAIILMHDLHQSTCIASQTFIPALINRGYQLVTVSDMAELRGVTLQPGQVYNSFKP